jgi:hypothetical protein
MEFKNDPEFMEFLNNFIGSQFWKYQEEILRSREALLFKTLEDPQTTPDGRAMLTGRLIEIRRLLNEPVTMLAWFNANKQASGKGYSDDVMRISREANPDIVTH